jgi:hypothetical protein
MNTERSRLAQNKRGTPVKRAALENYVAWIISLFSSHSGPWRDVP